MFIAPLCALADSRTYTRPCVTGNANALGAARDAGRREREAMHTR